MCMNIIHLLYMDNIDEKINNTTGLDKIQKTYNNLTYFDQYGSSVILYIIITIFVLLFASYAYIASNMSVIKDDWNNQRCNPYVIPFAGLINKPDNMSSSDFTKQNFTYCSQNILGGIAGDALTPTTFVINTLNNVSKGLSKSVNDMRGMFDKTRTFFQDTSEEIMGRIINVTIPLQQIIISFKDAISKIQGTMTGSMLTLFGSYYVLQSLMGAIAQFIVTILVALAIIIAALWAFPFTWGAAAANTAIFISIAIPFAIILAFMSQVLGVKIGRGIPRIRMKCFDENTPIIMNDGSIKQICDIQNGDILKDNNVVTAKMKLDTQGSIMYGLHGIIVSDTHMIKYQNKWIRVRDHPDAKIYKNYVKPYIYCLNTTEKIIEIGRDIFSDWDELDDSDINTIINSHDFILKNKSKSCLPILVKPHINKKIIHKYYDGGFTPDTQIELNDGKIINISDIHIGDILKSGDVVYGVVEIDGSGLDNQYTYFVGDTKMKIQGGPNLCICEKKIPVIFTANLENINMLTREKLKNKHDLLYHLLTDSGHISINDIRFYDYNACVDVLLDRTRAKILSAKYR